MQEQSLVRCDVEIRALRWTILVLLSQQSRFLQHRHVVLLRVVEDEEHFST